MCKRFVANIPLAEKFLAPPRVSSRFIAPDAIRTYLYLSYVRQPAGAFDPSKKRGMKYQSPRFSLFKAKNRVRCAGETQFFTSDYVVKRGEERIERKRERKKREDERRCKGEKRWTYQTKEYGGKVEKRGKAKRGERNSEKDILRERVGHTSPSISISRCSLSYRAIRPEESLSRAVWANGRIAVYNSATFGFDRTDVWSTDHSASWHKWKANGKNGVSLNPSNRGDGRDLREAVNFWSINIG